MSQLERLESEAAWRAFYPVLRDFWPVVDEAAYLEAVAAMEGAGYQAYGRRTDEPVTFAGCYRLASPWYGDFAWLVDLVTRPGRRGEGHGTACYEALEEHLREGGCETVVLASGLDRERAHAFYEDRGFERTEYWFEKEL